MKRVRTDGDRRIWPEHRVRQGLRLLNRLTIRPFKIIFCFKLEFFDFIGKMIYSDQ